MLETHFRTCPFCEAACGVALELDGDRVLSVRGDPEDPLSSGYICPKAIGLKDIYEDQDRLRQPLRRVGERFEPISWKEAFDWAAERISAVRSKYGADSVGVYIGNPSVHHYASTVTGLELVRGIGTRSCFTTASMDHLPHLLAAYQMFGHQLLLPVPDLDRCSFLLVLGANPVVSNGSFVSAPGMKNRLQALRQRGGRLVVVDPRRTATAELADTHLFIQPGTDAWLLAALVRTLFEESLVRLDRLADFTVGVAALEKAVQHFTPDAAAARTGIPASAIRQLARDFAQAPSAVCYGRVGVCTQEFGAVCAWLVNSLNVLTGNLDRAGGAAFTLPAADTVAISAAMGLSGSFQPGKTRLRGLPAFAGELPVAALAEEIETPGAGQIRALVCVSGNPVLSTPNGARLDRALPSLDFMVSIDFYLNETARHAHLILPPTFAIEHDHYDLVMNALAVRNVARYQRASLDAGPDARHDWQIHLELATRLDARRGGVSGWLNWLRHRVLLFVTPRRLLDLWLRVGPYGHLAPRKRRPFKGKGLSLSRLLAKPHGLDLGPLEPCLPERLYTSDKKLLLAPELFVSDLQRLAAQALPPSHGLVLIGRRQLRDNNSWMHNVDRLVKGKERCTLLMHPEDARTRGLTDGQQVSMSSRTGRVEVPLQLTHDIRPGVVSLPHGFGHGRAGTRLRVAAQHAGVSINDLTDETRLDVLSGTIAFSGVPVEVMALPTQAAAPQDDRTQPARDPTLL